MIFQALEAFETFHRQQINSQAIAEARGWSGLFNGFSGDDGQKTNPVDFLPFPELLQSTKHQIKDSTRRILIKLIRSGDLPSRAAQAAQMFEEIREALK